MELSPEDSLRLNVMLANAIAVRIDEGINVVHCLSEDGNKAKVQLNPNCRTEQYIRNVRELLSSHVMGSPGGYPVYLKRWTRMGQTSDTRLDDLLLLGEPEAVVAVTGAPALTDELARRAWWIMPDAANARRMLHKESVVNGEMGKILSEFLLEFLPFEESPADIIESVRLVLQPGLISEDKIFGIWNRGRQKNVFQVGFLHSMSNNLPGPSEQRADMETHAEVLQDLVNLGNQHAALLMRVLSSQGQLYLETCLSILKRPANQDVVCSLLEAIGGYFSPVRLSAFHFDSVQAIIDEVDNSLQGNKSEMSKDSKLSEILACLPELASEVRAMLILSHVGEPVVRPIFAVSDSVGSVMRKKIEHVSQPIVECMNSLNHGGLYPPPPA